MLLSGISQIWRDIYLKLSSIRDSLQWQNGFVVRSVESQAKYSYRFACLYASEALSCGYEDLNWACNMRVSMVYVGSATSLP